MKTTPVALVMIAASALISGVPPATWAASADLVLMHGKVITTNAKDSVEEALAVGRGRILLVGSDHVVQRLVGPKTRVVNLQGRTVTPGLIDAHAHVLDTGLDELFNIALADAQRMQDILDRVARRAVTAKADEWIQGAGWDETKLAERRYPTAAELDRVAPNNPVWLMNVTGHYGVANSAALKLAGISASISSPPGGLIEHAADGQPTGVLKETALDLVQQLVPAYSEAQRRRAIDHMLQLAHAEGMTGFKDPDISQDYWQTYRSLAAEGQLNEYVCVLFHTPPTMAAAEATLGRIRAAQSDVISLGRTPLRVCGAKIFMDGSGLGRTAWMYEDLNRTDTQIDVGNHGFPRLDPLLYAQQVKLFVDAGVSVGTHAIGDRAIDWVVDTYAAALRSKPQKGLRLAIIHANTPSDHAIAVMADLQKRFDAGIPETQAEFLWGIGDGYLDAVGTARAQRMIPLHSYLDKGMIWAGGSDTDVTPFPARYGLWASVARETVSGKTPFGLAQSVSVRAALRSYTIWAARQMFLEKETGSLERGKWADLAVWDRDPYTVPTDQLKDMVCKMTVFQGKVVYETAL